MGAARRVCMERGADHLDSEIKETLQAELLEQEERLRSETDEQKVNFNNRYDGCKTIGRRGARDDRNRQEQLMGALVRLDMKPRSFWGLHSSRRLMRNLPSGSAGDPGTYPRDRAAQSKCNVFGSSQQHQQ